MYLYVKIIQNPDNVNWDYRINLECLNPDQAKIWAMFLAKSKFTKLPNGSQYTDPGYRYNFILDYYVVNLVDSSGKTKHQLIVSDPGCNQNLTDSVKDLMAIFKE